MTYSAKQTSPKQISPKLLIQVTAALLLTLWLTGQTLAAPETILTTVDSMDLVTRHFPYMGNNSSTSLEAKSGGFLGKL